MEMSSCPRFTADIFMYLLFWLSFFTLYQCYFPALRSFIAVCVFLHLVLNECYTKVIKIHYPESVYLGPRHFLPLSSFAFLIRHLHYRAPFLQKKKVR